jgi:mRNA-degrading endonuclease RelE of RelBE toxin-antitoxin system
MPYNTKEMIFIETSLFTRLVPNYLSDDEYRAFQWYLLKHPEAGNLVPASGGLRKIRWGQKGMGKRGGVRVIYYWKQSSNEIWLITIYSKKERATIPGHILKRIAEEIENE